ncbi:MAG: hybrid sensor histidine kinase/response regulator [Robiginitomaculum sp.]|nr:hybrid sensor histidine kinase/response regulator [Robiginitomaculum sp.]
MFQKTVHQAYIDKQSLTRGGAALSALATLFMGAVLCIIHWHSRHDINILIWFAFLFALVITRWAMTHQQALKRVTFMDILVGLLWVVVVLICFPASPQGLQIFFALVIMGAGLSSALFGHRVLPAALGVIGFAMPLTALLFVRAGSDRQIFLALIIVAGWISALGLAWHLHKAFLSRIDLQFEKTALLQRVESHVEELEALRKMEKISRQIAEDANAAKSRFLAHASHDLRQPLHAIGLLLATIPGKGQNKQTAHILGRVKQSLDVLSDLFDSLLDVALLDTGQVDVNISVFSVGDILEQIVQDFASSAKQNRVQLSAVHSSLFVRSDPVIVRRIVQNLVSNAIAHSHNCRVVIGARRRGDTICLEVHDTGTGIALKDQNRIFDEFTKVATHKPKNALPGLGLGLAIVQRLTTIIDAKISLNSELGVGSVFRVENLPRVKEIDPIAPNISMTTNKHASISARIAIFDDDTEILKATENLVTKWGFQVDSYTGYDADTLRKPDIILCDYELMQSLNGIEVIAAIRETYCADIPAVLITGNNTKALIQQAKAAQLSVLFKPVKPAQLRSVLLTALSDEIL